MVTRTLVTLVTDLDVLEANQYLYDAFLDGSNEPDPDYTWDEDEPEYEYSPFEHLWMIYPV